MTIPTAGRIKAIFFDMNGTLRVRKAHLPTRQAALDRIGTLLNLQETTETCLEKMEQRYKSYSRWAQENLIQLPEEEVWSQWILPEIPRERIEPVAAEITMAWSQRKGHTIPREGAKETLLELKNRGYRLGVISNSLSTLDIPRCIDAFDWKELFEVVVLSSMVKGRKPAPEIFLKAISIMKIEAEECAYVGNRISRDVVGCRRAGFSMGIIIAPESAQREDECDQTAQPDAVIRSLSELLDIFTLPTTSTIKS